MIPRYRREERCKKEREKNMQCLRKGMRAQNARKEARAHTFALNKEEN